jgi:hypothetical protein
MYLLPGMVRNYKPAHYSFDYARFLALSVSVSTAAATIVERPLQRRLSAVVYFDLPRP